MSNLSLSRADIDRIIEMAWEDRTPFEAIALQFSLSNQDVIELMRKELTVSSFKRWRARTKGRATKHQSLRTLNNGRFKSKAQRAITHNKISKR